MCHSNGYSISARRLGAGGPSGWLEPGPSHTQVFEGWLSSCDALVGQKPLFHSLPSSGVIADGAVTANHPVAGDEDGDLKNRGVTVSLALSWGFCVTDEVLPATVQHHHVDLQLADCWHAGRAGASVSLLGTL